MIAVPLVVLVFASALPLNFYAYYFPDQRLTQPWVCSEAYVRYYI